MLISAPGQRHIIPASLSSSYQLLCCITVQTPDTCQVRNNSVSPFRQLPDHPFSCSVVQPGHAWLSQHYKWALDRAFLEQGHSHVIIVEDDMLFSPDFLHFFEATAVLLEQDPTLWCISTWNDNGLKTFDWEPMRMVHPLLTAFLTFRCHVLSCEFAVAFCAVRWSKT